MRERTLEKIKEDIEAEFHEKSYNEKAMLSREVSCAVWRLGLVHELETKDKSRDHLWAADDSFKVVEDMYYRFLEDVNSDKFLDAPETGQVLMATKLVNAARAMHKYKELIVENEVELEKCPNIRKVESCASCKHLQCSVNGIGFEHSNCGENPGAVIELESVCNSYDRA